MMKMIPIRNISVNNKYLRLGDNVDELVKSIEAIGIINPLTVNKKNELISGGRRYSALLKLKYNNVPVYVMNSSELEEELASIDENLIRKPLNEVEFDNCLRRGKEIYSKLHPGARQDGDEHIDSDIPAYSEVVAEKIGMSREAIKRAIARDEQTSSRVKEARINREIGTTDANHLLKLNKSEQNEILPYVIDVPKKKIKEIVKDVKEFGTEKAIRNVEKHDPLPKEFEALNSGSIKLSRVIKKIISDQVEYKGSEREEVLERVRELKNLLNELLRIY
jgi:ParB family chromosome partitioning protein